MTKDQLFLELDYVNAKRECRAKYAHIVAQNLSLVRPLIEIIFMGDKKKSPRAAWILEFVFKKDNAVIYEYLDEFCNNLSSLTIDSATRPCAKITEILIEKYYKNKSEAIIEHLNSQHKELLIEACFDWMIRDEKVAVKAYSMTSLYLLGTEYDWIHPELKQILERDYHTGSAGFKGRTRQILSLINKT